jgi:hypothetical protein
MNYYREKLINAIAYWAVLFLALVYLMITSFYQLILGATLVYYVQIDPVTVTVVLLAFLSLSKPIGGLIFAAAFWNMSRTVKYEKRIRAYMVISGWGIFLIFSANQAVGLQTTPFPPFGIPTVTVLNIAAFLVLIGIYNSARLVSVNNSLRKSIYQNAMQLRFLQSIGHAEMEKEVQKVVNKIVQSQDMIELNRKPIELDEEELKRYLDVVINEVKKEKSD